MCRSARGLLAYRGRAGEVGGLTSGPAWRTWERSCETEVQELEEREVRQLGSSGTDGRVAAHFAHSWRPWGLDELEPMAEACQLGGGWAAGSAASTSGLRRFVVVVALSDQFPLSDEPGKFRAGIVPRTVWALSASAWAFL